MKTFPNRRPSGTPAGGQFAPSHMQESNTPLVEVQLELPFGSGHETTTIVNPDTGYTETRHTTDGQLHDPGDGIPAIEIRRQDGSLAETCHYRNGVPFDPPSGEPARVRYEGDEEPVYESHYHNGEPCDFNTGWYALRYMARHGEVSWAKSLKCSECRKRDGV